MSKRKQKQKPAPSKFLPLAEAIADELMTCHCTTNVTIMRLVLIDANNKDWGGHCRQSVIDRVIEVCERAAQIADAIKPLTSPDAEMEE